MQKCENKYKYCEKWVHGDRYIWKGKRCLRVCERCFRHIKLINERKRREIVKCKIKDCPNYIHKGNQSGYCNNHKNHGKNIKY